MDLRVGTNASGLLTLIQGQSLQCIPQLPFLLHASYLLLCWWWWWWTSIGAAAATVLNDERLATKLSALKLISAMPFTFALSESKKDKSLEKEHSVKMHVHSAAATFLRSSSWMQLMTCNFVNWKSANVMSWKHKERRDSFPISLMLMKKATTENIFFFKTF